MAESQERQLKRFAHRQASDLLGEDTSHQRRARSAEGVRFAFGNLPVPGFRELVDLEGIADDARLVSEMQVPADVPTDT